MTIDELEKLAHAIDDFDPEDAARLCAENNEPPTCIACGDEYRIIEDDADPSALDDACAHKAVIDLARALLAVLPVIRAAEAWREAAPYNREDRWYNDQLENEVDTMHAALAKEQG